MELSAFEPDRDGTEVGAVACRSMRASYALSPEQIHAVVEEEFGEEALAEKADRDDVVVLVARRDDELVGFAEGVVGDDGGDVRWIHVDPDDRGQGAGTTLFEQLREALADRGVETVRGRVFAEDAEGSSFYERFGLERVGGREIDVGGEVFVEEVYAAPGDRSSEAWATDEPREPPDRARAPDGTEVHVDPEDPLSGTIGPFYEAYTTPEQDELYGYYCGSCGTVTTDVDAMDRIWCPECGNAHRPSNWDAAYL